MSGILSAEELTELRAFRAEETLPLVCQIYRSPALTSGKVGEPALHLDNVPLQLWATPYAGRLLDAFRDLVGGNATLIGVLPYGTDINGGDEIRLDGRTLTVENIGRDLSTIYAVALSEVRA